MAASADPPTATPSVPPSSRVVSLTAEPTPAFSLGSEPMIDSVAGAVVRVRPLDTSSIQATTGPQNAVPASKVEAQRNPRAIDASPDATTTLGPNRNAN